MKTAILLLGASLLTGCVSAQSSLVYGTFRIEPERGVSRCDNYARQTYRNVFNDLYDSRDGFGATQFARARAERAADIAYERCLQGRLN